MYDTKVQELADVITPHVLFDGVDQAREFFESYKQPESAAVPQEIRRMAEHFNTYAQRFDIKQFINPRAAHRTTISMISEAIRLCAKRDVDRHELKELADLGSMDRTTVKVLA